MSWIITVVWGGIVGLDGTSYPQAMYSRPIVAATIVGLLFGRPVEGAVLGAALEFFALPVLPFGAVTHPEAGTSAVAAAGAYFTAAATRNDELLLIAVVAGVLISHVAGYSVRLLRQRNAHMSRGLVGADGGIDPALLEQRHRIALGLDFLRAIAITGSAAPVTLVLLVVAERSAWSLPVPPLAVVAAAGGVMVGSTLHVFGRARHHVISLAMGALGGLLLLMVT